jgi:hypothetical protein
MPTIEIALKVTVPDGADVTISGPEGVLLPADVARQDDVERYWSEYLSDNGRKIYGAAARIENFKDGEFTLEDIAQNLSIDYESVRSMHRTSGRTARKWREDHGSPAPIRLIDGPYEWSEEHGGMRTAYHLPPGVADVIEHAPTHLGTPGV